MVLARYGVSAYGHSTPTGQDSDRGSAPGGLHPDMWNALVAFLKFLGKDLNANNYHEYFTDTFRSYQAQVDLHDEKPSLAAEPGTSTHGIGYAVDWDNDRPDWSVIQMNLRNYGAKYGLVHPFSDPTREEWHWQLIPGFKVATTVEETYFIQTALFKSVAQAEEWDGYLADKGLTRQHVPNTAIISWHTSSAKLTEARAKAKNEGIFVGLHGQCGGVYPNGVFFPPISTPQTSYMNWR